MAAANGDRDRVLQKSRDLRFLTGFETKVGKTGEGLGTAYLYWGALGRSGGMKASSLLRNRKEMGPILF